MKANPGASPQATPSAPSAAGPHQSAQCPSRTGRGKAGRRPRNGLIESASATAATGAAARNAAHGIQASAAGPSAAE